MKFHLHDLDWAVKENIISPEVKHALSDALQQKYEHKPTLSFSNLLYYLGGLIIISAMTFYITKEWSSLTGLQHFSIALGYAAIFGLAGHWLWYKKKNIIPGGILITAAVCMTPMAVYGLQNHLGAWTGSDPGVYRDFFHWINDGWALMEIATVATGIAAVCLYRFPFITLPVAFSLWFISMDLTAIIYGPDFSWDERKLVSMGFGAAMLIAAFIVDRRTRKDFAFWGYLFGMFAFWGGLTSLDSDSELGKFIYCMVNVGFMITSVLLERRIFIIFGGMGVALYLGHLATEVFKDDLLFTFALSGLGLAIIGLGVLYHRNKERIAAALLQSLPDAVRRQLPQFR